MSKWLEKHMKGVLVTPSLIFIILMTEQQEFFRL